MKLKVKVINNPHGINGRTLPTAASAVRKWYAFGVIVTAVAKENGWYKLDEGPWILADTRYIKVIEDMEAKPTAKTNTKSPPAAGKTLTTIAKGADSVLNPKTKASDGVAFRNYKPTDKVTEAVDGLEYFGDPEESGTAKKLPDVEKVDAEEYFGDPLNAGTAKELPDIDPIKNPDAYFGSASNAGTAAARADIGKITDPNKYFGADNEAGTASPTVNRYDGVVPWDDTFIADEMKIIKRNLGLLHEPEYRDTKRELYSKFNRFGLVHPDVVNGKTFSKVFITRPDINILLNGEIDKALGQKGTIGEARLNAAFAKDPMFYYLFNHERRLLLSLTKHYTTSHDFNTYLSNAAESFEVSDEFIETQEHGETLTGHKVMYAKHNIKSNTAGTFTISYTDDVDFDVYKVHKAWLTYMSGVYRGLYTPKRDYIKKRVLDYACSVYYFVLAPDGETILFWTKYFGVFPTNTPSSIMSWQKGNGIRVPEVNITYAYSFKEDFNPLTLAEFNMNSSLDFKYLKTYQNEFVGMGKAFTGPPFVETIYKGGGDYKFKLRYRADNIDGRKEGELK